MKKILFVTGTRADYGKMSILANRLLTEDYDVNFFVTGMHMMSEYGGTYVEIRDSGYQQAYEYINQRAGDPQDLVLSKTIFGFSDYIHEHKPDLVMIHGDRIEALACAIVCATNYVLCGHVEGGEVSGTIDEVYRHCNTKLSSHHFVCSQDAKRRLVSLGEEQARLHVIGSPELDFHARPSGATLEEAKKYYQIPFDDFGIVIMHSVTSEQETMREQALALFSALKASGRNFVVVSPNNDPGSSDIKAIIDSMPAERFRHIPSLRFSFFSELLRHASAMIGNSSTGVREAPFLGVPSLNLGTRQTNRAHAKSITNALCTEREAIDRFLSEEWGKRYPKDTTFGTGGSAESFVKVLADESFWDIPRQKYFHEEVPTP